MNFKIGDVVIVVNKNSPRFGQDATILSVVEKGKRWNWDGSYREGLRYQVEMADGAKTGMHHYQDKPLPIQYFADELKRKENPYDGNQVVSWENSVWQPVHTKT
ncbi:MAG: hypothetical protein ABL964_09830 [Steroidobacteraceae bacterium]